jgi:UDP-glucose 4-epimerase
MLMQVLVTGGAGFIGSHIVNYHLNKNDEVHVIDDLSTGSLQNINPFQDNPNFSFTKDDLLTCNELQNIVNQADRIYHMAAVVGVLKVMEEGVNLLSTNITATERLLKVASLSKRNPRILLASSSEVYGGEYDIPLKETYNMVIGGRRRGCSSYIISKAAVEALGSAYYHKFGLEVISLRLFNTIGPRQRGHYGMVVPRLIKAAINNAPIVVYGTGDQTRSFSDVRDVVELIDILAGKNEAVGQVFNVGRDEEVSINELAELIKKLAKSDSLIEHITYKEAYGEDFEDTMFRRPDLTKILDLTDYKYKWNLAKTLTDLINNFQSV